MLTNQAVQSDRSTPVAVLFRDLARDAGVVLNRAVDAGGQCAALAELGCRADGLQRRLAEDGVKAGRLWLQELLCQIRTMQADAIACAPGDQIGRRGVPIPGSRRGRTAIADATPQRGPEVSPADRRRSDPR